MLFKGRLVLDRSTGWRVIYKFCVFMLRVELLVGEREATLVFCKVAVPLDCMCCSGVISIGNVSVALGISEVEATLW